jgi:membrane protease YdiL (CAAX protease family)
MPYIVRYFAITFAVSWACFLAACALSRTMAVGSGLSLPATGLLLVGTFAPALVALAMTVRTDGVEGVRAIAGRVLRWRVRARWYVFAVGYMVAIKLAVALVYRITIGTWPRFGNTSWYVIIVAIVFSTPAQAGEEIGWRGYALPRLGARFGLARASVLLGIAWALWHLPLFFIPGVDNYGQPFAIFMVEVTALSVAVAWLYLNTGGSLLLTMLMHSAVNQTIGIVPSRDEHATNPFLLSDSLVMWLTTAFVWVIAVYLLVRMRQRDRGAGSRRRRER